MKHDWSPPSPLESVSTFWEFARWSDVRVRAGAVLASLANMLIVLMLSMFLWDSFVESGMSFRIAMVMFVGLAVIVYVFTLWIVTTVVFWRILRKFRSNRHAAEVIKANEKLIATFRSG